MSELLVSSGATRCLQIQGMVRVVPDLLGSGSGTTPNCVLTLTETEAAITVTELTFASYNQFVSIVKITV